MTQKTTVETEQLEGCRKIHISKHINLFTQNTQLAQGKLRKTVQTQQLTCERAT